LEKCSESRFEDLVIDTGDRTTLTRVKELVMQCKKMTPMPGGKRGKSEK
jgi:hypothetical protein